jgi:hypothetical protein
MLLVVAIELCAAYQTVRAVFAFRSARSSADVDGANLRALSAIAFAALGSGAALRYVGLALFAVLLFVYASARVSRGAATRDRRSDESSATSSSTEPSITV